jgi:beta-glucanase (GH16 family)
MSFSKIWSKLMNRKPKPIPVPTPPPVPTPAPGTGFSDNFSATALNTTNWIVSNWGAPGGGSFKPEMVVMSNGMLCLKMKQSNINGTVTSVGSEIQYSKLCGYGTYEWTMRGSSTASAPNTVGSSISGSITGLFNYVSNSETEIDFEIEGNRPNYIQMTTWHTTSGKENNCYYYETPLHIGFHNYKYIWSPGKVEYYVDGKLLATHIKNVPSTPAYPIINHWGSVDPNWGGIGTPDVVRYMWVSNFKFTPA